MNLPRLLLVTAALVLLPASAPGHADELAILAELNTLRTDPAGYALKLRQFRSLFAAGDQRYYLLPGDAVRHITNEGVAAVDETIDALARLRPLPPLSAAPILGSAARDFVEEQGPTGATGHYGASRTGPRERVKKRGGGTYIAETISYGANSPQDVVRQLIVDDGVASRGHRKILLSDEYSAVGIWCGPHTRYRTMCVLDFSNTPTGAYRS